MINIFGKKRKPDTQVVQLFIDSSLSSLRNGIDTGLGNIKEEDLFVNKNINEIELAAAFCFCVAFGVKMSFKEAGKAANFLLHVIYVKLDEDYGNKLLDIVVQRESEYFDKMVKVLDEKEQDKLTFGKALATNICNTDDVRTSELLEDYFGHMAKDLMDAFTKHYSITEQDIANYAAALTK